MQYTPLYCRIAPPAHTHSLIRTRNSLVSSVLSWKERVIENISKIIQPYTNEDEPTLRITSTSNTSNSNTSNNNNNHQKRFSMFFFYVTLKTGGTWLGVWVYVILFVCLFVCLFQRFN